MSNWQPIETAPNDGTRVLIWVPDRARTYVAYWDDVNEAWFCFSDRYVSREISHWMPLPAPPESGA